jgi:hypothetical protein
MAPTTPHCPKSEGVAVSSNLEGWLMTVTLFSLFIYSLLFSFGNGYNCNFVETLLKKGLNLYGIGQNDRLQ